MDALRNVYKNSQSQDFKRTVREIKNKVYAYTEMEQLVREATCNDASTPPEMLLKEIARGTFTREFSAIMAIVWKRLRDKGSQHHPYKCLVLLDYLLREGNFELVMQQCDNNLHLLQALTSFRLVNEHSIDVGGRVREKAHEFLRSLQEGDPSRPGGGGGGASDSFGAKVSSDGFGSSASQEPAFGSSNDFGGGGGGGGSFFDAQAGGDDWKSKVEWDDSDGPASQGFGGGGGGGGKFAVKIRDAPAPATSAAAVKLELGKGGVGAPSRARPTRGVGSLGPMPTRAPAAATSSGPNLFDVSDAAPAGPDVPSGHEVHEEDEPPELNVPASHS